MTGLRRSIYNPGMLRREELIASFTARTRELVRLVQDLQQGGNQHHLLIGQRGAGKTTLLLRLACAIDEDAQLSTRALALRFPEEQYNVARLSDFWLNCVDALVDALEQHGQPQEALALDERVEAIEARPPAQEAARAEEALQLLLTWAAEHERLLVLLVDNIDLVFQRLADSQSALRDALSRNAGLVVIGACSRYPEELLTQQAAFHEFFHVAELAPLPEEEARAMVLHLAEVARTPLVARVLSEEPGRFKALLVLSGGMPRTLALLYGILAQDSAARAEDDLELLLDQVTPYYKARFDELPAQSQQIVDAVALHWHPMTAAECAAKARMEINAASAQLNRLVKQGALQKSQGTEHSKLTFQVSERFFNIWYLMRASRRLRRKLLWLTGFLQTFYGQAEVERRARALLQTEHGQTAARDPEHLLAFAHTVEDPALRRTLLFQALTALAKQPPLDQPAVARDVGPGEDQRPALPTTAAAVSTAYDVQQRLQETRSSGATRAAEGAVRWNAASPWMEQVLARAAPERGLSQAEPAPAVDRGLGGGLDALVLASASMLRHGAANWPHLQQHLRAALADVNRADHPLFQPSLWQPVVQAGHAGLAAALLRELGKDELALPLHEALRAAGKGLRGGLTYLAPEVREPTQEILALLLAPETTNETSKAASNEASKAGWDASGAPAASAPAAPLAEDPRDASYPEHRSDPAHGAARRERKPKHSPSPGPGGRPRRGGSSAAQ
ncbi:MAG: ATP-binding protein [Myxococcales bacterium]|nr:ATP-binding protein [Myxococcales bacterium]